jgi:methyltransferase
MTLPLFTLSVILGLLLAETRLSARNEAELRRRGAIERKGDVYAAMAFAYPLAFIAMGLEGALRANVELRTSNVLGPGAFGLGPGVFLSGVLLFAASKALKYWAIGALGPRWTFRVLVLPGVPLVETGPYRYVAHPNYVAVVGELVGTAMMMKAQIAGPVALALFGALLVVRIRFETRMLHGAYEEIDG